LISALSSAARRDLGNARSRIEQLEKTLLALAARQRELESALTDAGASTPTTDTALRARRDELLSGLSVARDQAIAKRDRLASALENVRVQLLRLKSGLGVPADVSAELNAAESVANA
jgi:flagellar biosynthesis chaperone FliJ